MPYKDRAKRLEYAKAYRSDVDNLAKQTALMAERRKDVKRFIDQVKSERGCERCGEKHPACLDFHHRDPSEKQFSLNTAKRRGYTLAMVREEIAKCEVLCANCHRKEHWKRA